MPTPQNLPPKLGSRQNLNQFFSMKQSYFCNFDIKNEFLDPQNSLVAIFRYHTVSEMELRHYFQNLAAKSPSSGQKFKLR